MSYVPPKKNVAYRFGTSLTSQANTLVFQTNPTLAAGDVKVCKDFGAISNITTLPSVISSGTLLQVDLSASEMNADNVCLLFKDVAGDEWCDMLLNIQTSNQQIDDITFNNGRQFCV